MKKILQFLSLQASRLSELVKNSKKKPWKYFGFALLIAVLLFIPLDLVLAQAGVIENSFFSILNMVLLSVITLLGKLLVQFIDLMLSIISYNNFVHEGFVIKGWVVMRDVLNTLFIFFLLMIAFATIFNYESYGYKSLLGKVLLAAILVNFSRTIAGIAIDFSHVFMMIFLNGFKDAAAGNFTDGLGIRDVVQFGSTSPSDISGASIFGSLVFAVIYLLIAVVTILVYFLMFVLRIVALWFLVITSPVYFVLNAVPFGKQSASQWLKNFSKYLVIGPALAFFLWLSLAAMGTVSQTFHSQVKSDAGGTDIVENTGESLSAGISKSASPAGMMSYVISIGLLWGSLIYASKSGVAGSQVAGKAMEKMKKVGTKVAKSPVSLAKWGGREYGMKALSSKRVTNVLDKVAGSEGGRGVLATVTGARWAARSSGKKLGEYSQKREEAAEKEIKELEKAGMTETVRHMGGAKKKWFTRLTTGKRQKASKKLAPDLLNDEDLMERAMEINETKDLGEMGVNKVAVMTDKLRALARTGTPPQQTSANHALDHLVGFGKDTKNRRMKEATGIDTSSHTDPNRMTEYNRTNSRGQAVRRQRTYGATNATKLDSISASDYGGRTWDQLLGDERTELLQKNKKEASDIGIRYRSSNKEDLSKEELKKRKQATQEATVKFEKDGSGADFFGSEEYLEDQKAAEKERKYVSYADAYGVGEKAADDSNKTTKLSTENSGKSSGGISGGQVENLTLAANKVLLQDKEKQRSEIGVESMLNRSRATQDLESRGATAADKKIDDLRATKKLINAGTYNANGNNPELDKIPEDERASVVDKQIAAAERQKQKFNDTRASQKEVEPELRMDFEKWGVNGAEGVATLTKAQIKRMRPEFIEQAREQGLRGDSIAQFEEIINKAVESGELKVKDSRVEETRDGKIKGADALLTQDAYGIASAHPKFYVDGDFFEKAGISSGTAGAAVAVKDKDGKITQEADTLITALDSRLEQEGYNPSERQIVREKLQNSESIRFNNQSASEHTSDSTGMESYRTDHEEIMHKFINDKEKMPTGRLMEFWKTLPDERQKEFSAKLKGPYAGQYGDNIPEEVIADEFLAKALVNATRSGNKNSEYQLTPKMLTMINEGDQKWMQSVLKAGDEQNTNDQSSSPQINTRFASRADNESFEQQFGAPSVVIQPQVVMEAGQIDTEGIETSLEEGLSGIQEGISETTEATREGTAATERGIDELAKETKAADAAEQAREATFVARERRDQREDRAAAEGRTKQTTEGLADVSEEISKGQEKSKTEESSPSPSSEPSIPQPPPEE